MKDQINLHIKHRQYWRPLSPSMLMEEAAGWVEIGARSPSHESINFTYPVRPERRREIPAVVHADGCVRAQLVNVETNPRYHALIRRFAQLTGVPMLLNTSLNGPTEPIVNTPAEAVALFQGSGIEGSGMDALVLGDLLVQRREAR